jgi:hypothetical protein
MLQLATGTATFYYVAHLRGFTHTAAQECCVRTSRGFCSFPAMLQHIFKNEDCLSLQKNYVYSQ